MKKNKYPKYFTVGDLRKLIKNISDDLPIGVVGHFGEFVKADNFLNFKVSNARLIPESEFEDWKKADSFMSPIFEIISPDIGEPPD